MLKSNGPSPAAGLPPQMTVSGGALDLRPVPKVVHQVWLDGKPPPDALALMRHARDVAMAAGWAHRFHDRDLLCRGIDGYREWETTCKTVQHQANVARWLVLRQCGGLYLDADVELFRLPRDLRGGWISSTHYGPPRPGGFMRLAVNCCILAAPPGHRHFSRCLDLLARHHGYWPTHGGGNHYHELALDEELDLEIWLPEVWTGSFPASGRRLGMHYTKSPQWQSLRPAERAP